MIQHAMPRCLTAALVAVSAALLVANASADDGPVVLGGDDLTAHGERNAAGTQVFDGWLYIRKALENLAPGVTVANDGSVAVLGSSDSAAMAEDAGAAYHFAVPLAAATTSLSGAITFVEGVTAINQFFVNLANGTVTPAIIVSVGNFADNDQSDVEVAAMNANAPGIAAFVSAGGGLLAHGGSADDPNVYGWLPTLINGASYVIDCDFQTLVLTPAGQAAFPGLTNQDITTGVGGGACHGHFLNHGLTPLARDVSNGTVRDIIIGGAAVVPPPDEACCFPDGSCMDLAPLTCTSFGGTPTGSGFPCCPASPTCIDCPGPPIPPICDPMCFVDPVGGNLRVTWDTTGCECVVLAVVDVGCMEFLVENGQILDVICLDPDENDSSSDDSSSNTSGSDDSDDMPVCQVKLVDGILQIRSETAVLRVTVTDCEGIVVGFCTLDLCASGLATLQPGPALSGAGTKKRR